MTHTYNENLKYSIVIPTKLARDTIKETLKTVLSQSYENFEVVISDASQSDILKTYLRTLDDKRIKYVRPDSAKTISDDWDFALKAATGDLVTFLGDDDGLIPGALEYANRLFSYHTCDAITWKKINYNWPDHIIDYQKNTFEGQSEPVLSIVNARRALKLLADFRLGYARLPCIYNSFIKMENINFIRKNSKDGKFFSGVIPDVYSSIAIAACINNYVYASFPLSVNGASSSSSGVMQGIPKIEKKQKNMISDVLNSHTKYHKDIGKFNTSIGAIVMGEYLLAKENLCKLNFPKPSWNKYVKYLFHEAKSSKTPELIIKAATFTIAARNIKCRIPKNFTKPRNPQCSFNGRLELPEEMIGDVYQASILCKSLIPDIIDLSDNGLVASARQLFWSCVNSFVKTYQNYKIRI